MANVKQTFKTPLLPLFYVSARGQGKLNMDAEDNGEPSNYHYCATVKMTKEQADDMNKVVDKFWRDNKPDGVGKRKYELVKEEMVKVIGPDGKPMKDADDEPIRKATGLWTIQAKTITHWPKDGKPNVVKLLGSGGQLLSEDHTIGEGCGEGTMGIIHGSLGINSYSGNEGVQFYLNGVQIKESTYTPYAGAGIEADEIEDDVADTSLEDEAQTGAGPAI